MNRLSTYGARLRLGLIVIGLLVFIIFLVQNTDPIPISVLFLDLNLPGAILILVTALAGFAAGYYVAFTGQRRRHKRRDARTQAKAERRQSKPAEQDET